MSKLPVSCFWLASWVFTSELKRLALSILCGACRLYPGSRAWRKRAPHLPGFILLGGFSSTLPVVSILLVLQS